MTKTMHIQLVFFIKYTHSQPHSHTTYIILNENCSCVCLRHCQTRRSQNYTLCTLYTTRLFLKKWKWTSSSNMNKFLNVNAEPYEYIVGMFALHRSASYLRSLNISHTYSLLVTLYSIPRTLFANKLSNLAGFSKP